MKKFYKLFCVFCIYIFLQGTANAQWTWQNPLPQGNDLNDVFFTDQNIGYATGRAGTIIKTIDGGDNWVIQTSNTINELFGISFTDNNNGIIVGAGGTILRTNDGGNNWELVSSGTSDLLFSVSFANTNTGIAVGNAGLILRTTDGGANWSNVVSGTTAQLRDISFKIAAATVVGNNGLILKSTDQGISWTTQTSGTTNNLWSVSFFDENLGVAVSSDIHRTTDGGQNWTVQQTVTSTLWSVQLFNENIGYCAGDQGKILKTTDGGNTWNLLVTPQTEFRAVSLTDLNTCTVTGMMGSIYKSMDGGTTWIKKSSGHTTTLKAACLTGENTGLAAGSLGKIYKTTDKGISWIQKTSPVSSELNSMCFLDENTGFIAGASGRVIKTTDGGESWSSFGAGSSYTFFSVSFLDSNIGYAVGSSGSIFKTTNSGENWSQKLSGTMMDVFKDVIVLDANTVISVGGTGRIAKTTDGGSTWVNKVSGTTKQLCGVDFNDFNNGIAVGTGIILTTTDGGESWSTIPGIPNKTFNRVDVIDANNAICVGTEGFILRTSDGGNTWNPELSGAYNSLLDVDFLNSDIGIIVGSNGTILRYDQSIQPLTSFTENFDDVILPAIPDGWTKVIKVLPSNTAAEVKCVLMGPAPTPPYSAFLMNGLDGTNGQLDTNAFVALVSPLVEVGENGAEVKFKALGGNPIMVGTMTDPGDTSTYSLIGEAQLIDGVFTEFVIPITDPGNKYIVFKHGNLNTVRTLFLDDVIFKQGQQQLTFPLTVPVQNSWNMVSIPGLHPIDQNVLTWWVNKDPGASVYKYNNSYEPVTTVQPGTGYWMKHSGDQVYNTGEEWPEGGILFVNHDPILANAGWNLIGGYDNTAAVSGITTTPEGLQTGFIYGYSSSTGYTVADNLVPGYGYWINLTGSGSINIPSSLTKTNLNVIQIADNAGKIIITDNSGRRYTLYAISGNIDLNNYLLPPAPPNSLFDIRYASGRFAEDITSEFKSVEMQGISYPVKVRVEGMSLTCQDESGKLINAELKPGTEITISNSLVNKLMVLSGEITPLEYTLEQNYPNPFNPSTSIKFSIAEPGRVRLTVYNAIGQKIKELVNTELEAGKYNYSWNADKSASGIYFYELVTKDFVSTKKMLLIK